MSDVADGRAPLPADERHRAILERVDAQGSVTVRELAESLGVAAVTIRVDVRELARRGLINRVHGGATRLPVVAPRPEEAATRERSNGAPAQRVPLRDVGAATRTHSIGVIVPHAAYYYPAVVAGARGAAEATGARLVLGVSQNDIDEERALAARFLESGIDGLVIATRLDPQTSPETEEWLRSLPVPVVLAERRAGHDSGAVESIATDHERGAYEVVRHLVETGHRALGLLTFTTITAPRLRRGFDEALGAFGLPASPAEFPTDLLDESPREMQQKVDAIVDLVRAGRLDALIVHHDTAALPVVGRLRQSGVEVPEQLSVVAYDDELAALSDPPLTAMAPPRAAVGSGAIRLLVDRLEMPSRPLHQILLRPELRPRASVRDRT